jgi:hypothetical protein
MARDKNKDELKDNVLEHEFREQAQESMEEVRFSQGKKQEAETDEKDQNRIYFRQYIPMEMQLLHECMGKPNYQ